MSTARPGLVLRKARCKEARPTAVLRKNAGLVGSRGRSTGTRRLPPLRRLRDGPQQLRLELGLAAGGEQPVLLLLDVGQLRVAETFDRARRHQGVDEAAVSLQELGPVADLEPAPATGARDAQSAELADDDGLASVRVPGVVCRVSAGAAAEGALDRAVPAFEVGRRAVVVEGAQVAGRVLPAVVRDDGPRPVELM